MDIRHPHFAEPVWLWLAVLAPVGLLALQRYAAWARKKRLTLFAAPESVPDLVRSHSPARRMLKNVFLVLAVAGIGITLARPQWGETNEVSTALGEDILFVLDCSKSMLAVSRAPSSPFSISCRSMAGAGWGWWRFPARPFCNAR